MSDLLLVEKRLINNVIVDGFYRDEQALFNRFQIGSALEYTDPAIAIAKIHKRHKERLDQFSFLYQSGKGASKREMVLFTTLKEFLKFVDGVINRRPTRLWIGFTITMIPSCAKVITQL